MKAVHGEGEGAGGRVAGGRKVPFAEHFHQVLCKAGYDGPIYEKLGKPGARDFFNIAKTMYYYYYYYYY